MQADPLFINDFMPHVHCYLANALLTWTMFATDLVIGLAYFGISLTLVGLIRQVRLPFSWIVLCFGVFIGACGVTHLMEVWTLWRADYWVSAAVKTITAAASLGTAVYLVRLRTPILAFADSARVSEQRRVDLEQVTANLEAAVQQRTRELTDSRAEFQSLANSMTQLAWMADANGWIHWYNDRWYEYTGTTLNEMQGWGWEKVHHPDHRDRVVAFVTEAWKTPKPWELTFPLRSRTGEWRWFLTRAVPIVDSAGTITRWFGTNTDVTEQKALVESLERAQREAREKHDLLQAIIDASPSVIFTKDLQGRLTLCNRRYCELLQKEPEEVLGRTDFDLLGRSAAELVTRNDAAVIQSGETRTMEEAIPHADDGTVHTYLTAKFLLRDAHGVSYALCGIATDITQRKQDEERMKATAGALEEAIRARDEFLSIASHELKTPISSMALQAQGYKRVVEKHGVEAITPERSLKLVVQTDKQVERLSRLVDDMLDISRIRTGRLSMTPEEFVFDDMVHDVLERLGPQLVEASGDEPPVVQFDCAVRGTWDRLRLEQVVVNLLTNAMRYGGGKRVGIFTHCRNERVVLRVQDHGVGIAKDDQSRIFNRFERAIDKNEVSGLGLGLFITRQIVEAHGGTIRVESEPGRGATFIVELPLTGARA